MKRIFSRLRLAQKAAGAEHIWPVLGNADHILKPGGAGLVSSFLSLYKEWRLQAVKDGAAPLIRKIIADTDYLTYVSGLSGRRIQESTCPCLLSAGFFEGQRRQERPLLFPH